jgi:hypothetical protein
MQTGWFKEVHVKDFDSHSVRALSSIFCAVSYASRAWRS